MACSRTCRARRARRWRRARCWRASTPAPTPRRCASSRRWSPRIAPSWPRPGSISTDTRNWRSRAWWRRATSTRPRRRPTRSPPPWRATRLAPTPPGCRRSSPPCARPSAGASGCAWSSRARWSTPATRAACSPSPSSRPSAWSSRSTRTSSPRCASRSPIPRGASRCATATAPRSPTARSPPSTTRSIPRPGRCAADSRRPTASATSGLARSSSSICRCRAPPGSLCRAQRWCRCRGDGHCSWSMASAPPMCAGSSLAPPMADGPSSRMA